MSRGRHNKTWERPDQGEWNLYSAERCPFCRKKAYPSRRIAKRALRVFYPASRGVEMTVYRCDRGGQGWHLGHRDPRFTRPDKDPRHA